MKFCYIISTCDKYLDNRVKFQMESSFLKDVPTDDIYYLTSKPNVKDRQFGWNCLDTFETITWKYIHFIYNMELPQYDWYIFIDDDTFVFKNRLYNLLHQHKPDECYYIGKELDHIKRDFGLYMSGGAGYAISNGLYKLIYSHVRNTGINLSFKHWCDDLCIGLWIQEIAKTTTVNQINDNRFNVGLHANDGQLTTDITFHKVITKEQYDFYGSIADAEYVTTPDRIVKKDTVFTLVTDGAYFERAKRTIIDLRTRGNWTGDVVLIAVGFTLNTNFKDFYNITEVSFATIDKSTLLAKIGSNGFTDTTDKREIYKLAQWEKFHVFDEYFTQWSRVVYLDAGLRVLDDVKYLLELEYKGRILAPKDGKLYQDQAFKCQLSTDNPELIANLRSVFGETMFTSNYMLNCMWIYDTNILKLCNKQQLIDAMNKYTCCKTNEMGIMNILFCFKYNLWDPFPEKAPNGKFLFDWCELNQTHKTTWREYCYMKYPVTISFGDV